MTALESWCCMLMIQQTITTSPLEYLAAAHTVFFSVFFFLFTIPVPILFSGEALDCGRYISSLPCSSASRWRNVSPRVYSNECVVFHMNGSWDLYPSFFFPGLQTFTSVWMKGSVSSPVQSPLPLWDVWVQWNVN